MITDFNELFRQLNKSEDIVFKNSNYYIACPVPGYPKHRLAKDNQNHPCLLISTSSLNDSMRPAPIELEHLFVLYDAECKVLRNNSLEEKRFTVICCTEQDLSLQNYFLRICSAVISVIGKEPSRTKISNAVDKLVELFRALSQASRKSVQGLWAELLLISLSTNPEFLIKAWHQSPLDKYDFSKDNQRIEVKSSTARNREHHFSLEQLVPPLGIKVLIASIFIERVGTGISILELVGMIRSKVKSSPEILFHLDRIIGLTLGKELKTATKDRFDYQLAKKSIAFYSSEVIPCINPNLPKGVSDVHFRADLSDIPAVNKKTFKSQSGIFRTILSK